jgi:hypothetical protein
MNKTNQYIFKAIHLQEQSSCDTIKYVTLYIQVNIVELYIKIAY